MYRLLRGLCTFTMLAGAAVSLLFPQPAMAYSDMAIKMEAAPDPVALGQPLTYTISVTNLGPDPARFITVTDNLPYGVDLKSISMTGGECTRVAGIPFCDLESLAVGKTAVIRITIVASEKPDIGTLVNTAKVIASDNEDDPRQNNRADTITAIKDEKKKEDRPAEAAAGGCTNAKALHGSAKIVSPGCCPEKKYQTVTIPIEIGEVREGEINVRLTLGKGSSAGSFGLYQATKSGTELVAKRYDVSPGSTTQLNYAFKSAGKFSLSMDGNWFSKTGSSNSVEYEITIKQCRPTAPASNATGNR